MKTTKAQVLRELRPKIKARQRELRARQKALAKELRALTKELRKVSRRTARQSLAALSKRLRDMSGSDKSVPRSKRAPSSAQENRKAGRAFIARGRAPAG